MRTASGDVAAVALKMNRRISNRQLSAYPSDPLDPNFRLPLLVEDMKYFLNGVHGLLKAVNTKQPSGYIICGVRGFLRVSNDEYFQLPGGAPEFKKDPRVRRPWIPMSCRLGKIRCGAVSGWSKRWPNEVAASHGHRATFRQPTGQLA